jgi:hypothetical protein
MDELKAALGTPVDVTVFRKPGALGYRISYSHRGGFYTLDEIARFDAVGLWSFRAVYFSQFGTLLAYPEATDPLVLADGGGSNGARTPGLETHRPAPPLRPPRPHRHRLPLSRRRLKMEPHRAIADRRCPSAELQDGSSVGQGVATVNQRASGTGVVVRRMHLMATSRVAVMTTSPTWSTVPA